MFYGTSKFQPFPRFCTLRVYTEIVLGKPCRLRSLFPPNNMKINNTHYTYYTTMMTSFYQQQKMFCKYKF